MPGNNATLTQVRAALEHEPRVGLHRCPFEIDLDSDGTLTLEGEAESIAAKKLALELAASAELTALFFAFSTSAT